MSTKKKPSKPAAPQPLLKLAFAKFPGKQVGVYFEKTKLCFYADFGFNQYESPSVAGLKQKIEAAIKGGITPEPVWVPMIEISIDIDHGRIGYKQALDLAFDVDIERQYYCIGRGGHLMECGWDVPQKSRSKEATEVYGSLQDLRPRALNAPIYKADGRRYQGGAGVNALVPYTDQLWKDLGEQIRELRASAAGMIHHVAAGKLEVFTNFIFDFEQHVRSEAKKKSTPKKPAPPKAATPKPDPHQPLLPLATAKKPALGKPFDKIREDVKRGSAPKKKPAPRPNGDNTAREHLVVKYQGKQLTLGHGPLGNYLVEALRKHWPTIHSAFCLKDNCVQISFTGSNNLITIDAAEFEQKINHPPVTTSVVIPGAGAIAKLQEIAAEFSNGNMNLTVVPIPGIILEAAGFPAKATAEIQQTVLAGAPVAEIIVRVPKKAPQFLSVQGLQDLILKQARAAEEKAKKPEDELVPA